MLTLALVVSAALAAGLVLQAIPTLGFARVLGRGGRPPLADSQCPKAAVILCLRGEDPFLGRCLESLFEQSYPDFTIFVVVDSMLDPAYETVCQSIAEHGPSNVVVDVLTNRLDTCSLKGSSIVQAMSRIDDSYKIVAMIDSDVIPHPTWLRELAAPLTDDAVGVSSGTRWYMPARPSWGGFVRYYWNAAANVQMYWNEITWGGSVALRGEIARHPEMIRSWKTAVSTDTVILRVVHLFKKRAEFVPSLMMINRETCRLSSFYTWVQRQMVVVRLYHKGWIPILIHGFLTVSLLVAGFSVMTATLVRKDWGTAALMFSVLMAYWVGFVGVFHALEEQVRAVVKGRGEPVETPTLESTAYAFLTIFITPWVYAAVLLKACFIRHVDWRGIGYELKGPHDVRLVSYRPYVKADRPRDVTASL